MNSPNPIVRCRKEVEEWHAVARNRQRIDEVEGHYVHATRQLLSCLQKMERREREQLIKSTPVKEFKVFASIIVDAAVHSVQSNTQDDLGWGLLAMLFIRPMSVEGIWNEFAALHHSAKKLDYDLEGYYWANRDLALPEMQEALDRYFERGGMDLSETGYKEGTTKSGEFTYTFRRSHEWPKYE